MIHFRQLSPGISSTQQGTPSLELVAGRPRSLDALAQGVHFIVDLIDLHVDLVVSVATAVLCWELQGLGHHQWVVLV